VAAAAGPTLVLALRHALRRRRRLAVSLALLAFGGATFMSGLNVAAASDRQLATGDATLGYDLELSLTQPQPVGSLLGLVRAVPGVAHTESIGVAPVVPVRPGEVPVAGTHKDGGHGTVRVYALAPDTRFKPAVQAGRWLEPGDVDAILVQAGDLDRLGIALGDAISLSIAERTGTWRVVGTLAAAGLGHSELYISDAGFARVTEESGTTRGLRIVTTEHDSASRQGVLRALERAFAAQGIGVAGVVDADWRSLVLRAHVAIVQGALQTLGLVLGVVGALTLASAMSLSVVERTREFGVMQTLGATPARVIWIVVAEALFVGAVSWLAALVMAALLSALLGSLIGSVIFGAPLALVVAPAGVAAWLAVSLLGSAAASAFPAAAASRLTIRETLAYA
jgi:putative ABC transport system permease protein